MRFPDGIWPTPGAGCAVNHIVEAPQPKSGPLFVVFTTDDPSVFTQSRPGVPQGPFYILDEFGRFVEPFERDDVLDNQDAIIPFGPDGQIAFVFGLRYAASMRWTQLAVHVVPIVDSPRPVFSLLVGTPDVGFTAEGEEGWTWRLRRVAQGETYIDIGPTNTHGSAPLQDVTASFKVDEKAGTVTGPSGAPDKGFTVVESPSSTNMYRAAESWPFISCDWKSKHPLPQFLPNISFKPTRRRHADFCMPILRRRAA